MKKTFVIAEAGVNHNGSLDTAKKLVDMASECGADAVKFQTFKAHELTGKSTGKAKYQEINLNNNDTQYEMIKKLELPFECFAELKKYSSQKNIIFISTPDGMESLDFLVSIDVPIIKIGSTEVTNPAFLKAVGLKGKPIILSTGMSTLGEVDEALASIYSTGNKQVSLLHCTTDYPTTFKDVNMRAMLTLKEAFKTPVGFSDHTCGVEAAVTAVALGAEIIEKHITLDTEMEGPDHRASAPPAIFADYVKSIRNTEILLGDGIKRPTENENLMMENVRRSVVASGNLKKGTLITQEMLAFKRPGTGIAPKLSHILIGKTLKRDIPADEHLTWSDI